MLSGYSIQISFAVIRLAFWFVLLFGIISPLLFNEINQLPKSEKFIYSWLGMGGVILFSIAALTLIHLYDFFSIVLTVILIMVIRSVWVNREQGLLYYLEHIEHRMVVSLLKVIEEFKNIRLSLSKYFSKKKGRKRSLKFNWKLWLFIIVVMASFIMRFYPALIHAEPFSREWFHNLLRTKEIRLQNYFGDTSKPGGLYAFITLFSILTQVSPEMILHVFGALNSILLMLLIFWSIRQLIGTESYWSPLFGMAVFGLLPFFILPVQLNSQIEANSIQLALSFALPAIVLFAKERDAINNNIMFYILAGIVATGLVDIFILLVVLLPLIFFVFIVQISRYNFKRNIKDLFKIILASITSLMPGIVYIFSRGINPINFIQQQLFLTSTYSVYPFVIIPLNQLSQYYLFIAILFLFVTSILLIISRDKKYITFMLFMSIFIMTCILFTSYTNIGYNYIDLDQLNIFYAVVISILLGIIFYLIVEGFIGTIFFKKYKSLGNVFEGVFFIVIIIGGLYFGNSYNIFKTKSSLMPNALFKAYYKVINNYIPHTYTIVAPDIDSTMAMNRNEMMDYNYFLHDYVKKDSAYYSKFIKNKKKLTKKDKHKTLPNIFVFVEDKPYDKIRSSVLNKQKSKMKRVNSWIRKQKQKKYRKIKTYYKSSGITVYEIINDPYSSSVHNVLFHNTTEEGSK